MDQLGGIILLAAPVVAFIVTLLVTKRVAQMIYNKTGYNGFASLQQILCASISIIAIIFALLDNNTLMLLSLVPVIILILLNLKAKNPAYIVVLTVLQLLYGAAWLIFMILKIALNYVLHFNMQGLNIQLDEINAVAQEQAARQQEAAWVAQREKDETADAYAQRLGFRNADDAERAGIDESITAKSPYLTSRKKPPKPLRLRGLFSAGQPMDTHSFFREDSYRAMMSFTGCNPSCPVTRGGLPRSTASITSSYCRTKEGWVEGSSLPCSSSVSNCGSFPDRKL